jgi:hypothetical protein
MKKNTSTTTSYTALTIDGDISVTGNVNFAQSPIVPLLPTTDDSTKVASTSYVQAVLTSFVQAGTKDPAVANNLNTVDFPTPFLTSSPYVLVTALTTGAATVSAVNRTQFSCSLTGGCTGFNWVAMAI